VEGDLAGGQMMRIRLFAKLALVGFLLQLFPLRSEQSLSKKYEFVEASQSTNAAVLSLRFVKPSRSFAANGAFEIQAELKNEGTQTVLVCRELRAGFGSDEPCDWEFSIRDASGRGLPGVRWAGDRVVTSRDDFATALAKHWIALAPGYSYSTLVDVAIGFSQQPPPPGRYEITGVLTSYGLDGPSIYNDLATYPHDIEKLPYPGWKGTIGSNKIWIMIDPPRQKSR
jgi:hypothetical protein